MYSNLELNSDGEIPFSYGQGTRYPVAFAGRWVVR